MSDNLPEAGGHQNIVLTSDEKKFFGQMFQAADSENLGVVTGELAVKLFERSGLGPRLLGEIWGIADTENRGLLTKVGFSVALRLIGQAQNGQHPRPELAQQPGPLPHFDAVAAVFPSLPTTSPPPPATVIPPPPPGPPPGGMIRVPNLMPQDVDKYTALFGKYDVADGLLQGNIAREIFQRSRLPTPILIQIWSLADQTGRGALVCAEFVVAMHLITCCKSGALPALPQILPPGLYDAAAGRPPNRSGPDRRAPGRVIPPIPPIPNQFSGPQAQRAQSPLSRNFTPPVPQNANAIQRDLTGGGAAGGPWAVTPADKQRFDAVFLTVDKAGRGFITGDEAVPFFSNSKLPEDVLAQIWDLADIHKAGQLNRDEFAIAMYLIVQQRSNPGMLPETLPLSLIPPSVRQQRQLTGPAGSAVQPPSPFDPPQQPPPPKSAAEDLFGLDNFTSGGAQSQAGPGPTPPVGPFDNDAWGPSKGQDVSPPMSGAHSPIPNQPPSFLSRPAAPAFVPQSSFGQSILPSNTGGSNHSAASRAPPQQQKGQDMDDLLGDADPEVSKKVTNETMELANLSNQIGSLTKQTQELNITRVSAESDLSSLTTQKQHIEAQLAQLRAAYEKEAAQVKQVEEQLAISRRATATVTQDYHKMDAELTQLQYKKQELLSQLEGDKRENENLKERMNAVNIEARSLREELERLQSQPHRERGLVAVNRMQLEKSEQGRDKLKSGIEEAQRPRAASPPPPGSPTLSHGSISHNPFHAAARKSPPPISEGAFSASPFAPPKQSMDDVFGPFSSTPPPGHSFPRPPPDSSTYTPSGTESAHGGRSTPTTSAPPSSYHGSPPPPEAPPPAVGSQMTPFLPLPINRADSTTSSMAANASGSVRNTDFSRPDTPTGVFGPTTSVEAPGRAAREGRSDSFSVKSDAGTEASGRPAFSPFDRRNDSPFAGVERNNTGTTSGGDENKPRLEKSDSFSFNNNVPGALPMGDSSTPIKATPTGESTRSNRSRGSNFSRAAAFGGDPFSIGKNEAASASSKDFDEAFNKFTAVEHHTGGSGSISAAKFHDEFPPIKEVRPDSDSDSEGGFDDNFTTASPQAKLESITPTNANQGLIFDPAATDATGAPPTAPAQQSPPAYSGEKPYEFGLPSRSDPMRHDAPTPGGSANAVVFPSTPAAATKDEFDDDAFGDLAEAKEADEKCADNDFVTSPTFGDDFNFDEPTMASGDNEVFGFTYNIDGTQQRGQVQGDATKQPVASPQDWDDIFANFVEPSSAQQQQQPLKENVVAAATADQSGTDPGEGGVSQSLSSSNPATTTITTAEGDNGGKVEKLTGMGFDRESSVKALEKNGWNIDRAINSLVK